MAKTEECLSTLEARFDTFTQTLANQLATINERFAEVCRRLDGIRAWLIALTGLAGVQLAATVGLAIAMSRLGR
jgi:hypothetical protein